MTTNDQHQQDPATCTFRRIGQGFCGSVWAAEGGEIAMKREDGGPGRSIANDYAMHKLVLEASSQDKKEGYKTASVCVPRWPRLVLNDDCWWDENLARFPPGYTACNMLCSERIPPLGQRVRDRLVDRYCPAASVAAIKSNDADRDCLVRLYLGRRKIQNDARRNFFSLRNYPLHLNQAEDLDLDIVGYARAMAETLAMMHWAAQIDANDIEFVIGGCTQQTGVKEYNTAFLEQHNLWVLDFDCCKPLPMDGEGIEQAARAFLRNDPYFPRPSTDPRDHSLWLTFRSHYLETSRGISDGTDSASLPARFIIRVEELHGQSMVKKSLVERP